MSPRFQLGRVREGQGIRSELRHLRRQRTTEDNRPSLTHLKKDSTYLSPNRDLFMMSKNTGIKDEVMGLSLDGSPPKARIFS